MLTQAPFRKVVHGRTSDNLITLAITPAHPHGGTHPQIITLEACGTECQECRPLSPTRDTLDTRKDTEPVVTAASSCSI